MKIDIKIPPMGESITQGLLSTWHVKNGQEVSAGQLLYDLETDKISSEGLAENAGTITIQVEAGKEVQIGQVVGVIDTLGTSSTPTSEITKEVETLSPAVRRIQEESGIEAKKIEGTGKKGRVTKEDMKKAYVHLQCPQPEINPQAPSTRTSLVKMSPMRQKIAQRLVMAQHEAAMLTTFNEVDMSRVIEIRKKYQETFVAKHGVKLGFMSFFVKAAVYALKQVPEINAQIIEDSILQNHYYDISIAIGGAKGLVVPVLRSCDCSSFSQIEKDIATYTQKAKESKLNIEDMQGGVFTISNGGVYGSLLSTPILNPPQSGILGIHAIKERPIALNGQIVIRPMMNLALTYDHRLIDGKQAVTFLIKIKEYIEDPSTYLIESLLDIAAIY